MRARILLRLVVLWTGMLLTGVAFAQMPPTLWPQDHSKTISRERLDPVAVIYFTGPKSIPAHTDMAKYMVHQAQSTMGLIVQEHVLEDEKQLADTVEKIAEEKIGLIIIVEPRDIDALMKIPGLYPDIDFSIIDVPQPLYLTNVRSMQFRDSEGAFMIGALAATYSKAGSVAFVSKDDNETTRNMAYAFFQGAKYTTPDIQVVRQLGARAVRGKPALIPSSGNADIVFVLDEELFEPALRNAREEQRLVITYDRDLSAKYPAVVLTSLLKHYDLAIYSTLKHYRDNNWRPGSQTLGVGEGYIDYVLNASNRPLLPKELIEKVERTKDLLSQGIIKPTPLGQ